MKQHVKSIMLLGAIPLVSLGCLPLLILFSTTGISLLFFLTPFLITPILSCIAVGSARKQLRDKLLTSMIALVMAIMSCFCFYGLLYRQFPNIDTVIRNRQIVSAILLNSVSVFSMFVMELCTISSLYKRCLPRMIMMGFYAVATAISSALPHITDIMHRSFDEQTVVVIGIMILIPFMGILCINKVFKVYDEKHRILWVSVFGAYVVAVQTWSVARMLGFQYPFGTIVISLLLCLPQLTVMIWIAFRKVLNRRYEPASP